MIKEIRHTQTYKETIDHLGDTLQRLPQVEMPLIHLFAPGVYYREIFMPAGTLVIGHEHKTEHFNIVLTGRAKVMMDGVIHDIKGPDVFVSPPGTSKILHIVKDMRWATIHPSDETDIEVLEDILVTKSPSYYKYQAQIEALIAKEII